jgi:hypothetical protein
MDWKTQETFGTNFHIEALVLQNLPKTSEIVENSTQRAVEPVQ